MTALTRTATRTRVSVPGGAGRWTTRVCEQCRRPRCMPACEIVCRRCAPDGGPRSYRLAGLREQRILKDHSAETLAAWAGVRVETVLRAERPGRRVHTATAAAIAEALGTSVVELTDREEKA